ncbi:HepT-like ribonuclease domain-containing protein [Spirosoma panaciterrae]|uniref:HepT-like ribonuclease domain-containing protein n=1 Tax=Spirosoma panaciterrae TaxID=496058 RepID=UPI00036BDD02|nr:DUF86 domain-containing protein [Spirosoma panaciterrae]
MKDDLVYIEHIIQALERISSYTDEMTEDAFLSDTKTQDACIRQFEIVGEATKRLSLSFRDRFTQIPWRRLAGMRDKLIHDYIQVDLAVVWSTVSNDVTPLFIELEAIYEILLNEEQSNTTN